MKEWVKWLALGILSIAFGIFVLGNAVAASLAIATVTGFLFLCTGAFQVFAGFSAETSGQKVLSICLGALMVLIGISFLFNPLEGVISLALVVTILLGASGLTRIIWSRRMKGTEFFWPMLISGIMSLLLAIYILLNFDTASVTLLGILLGVELLLNGAGMAALAFFIRAHRSAQTS